MSTIFSKTEETPRLRKRINPTFFCKDLQKRYVLYRLTENVLRKKMQFLKKLAETCPVSKPRFEYRKKIAHLLASPVSNNYKETDPILTLDSSYQWVPTIAHCILFL